MKREIVLSTSGGRILTGSGLRPVAGNSEFGTGAKVFVLDNAILGQKRTQARRKPFEIDTVTIPPPISDTGYKLATTALKMLYFNTDFELQRQEDIAPPVEGATLKIHCYNDTAEFFVWFIDGRCIIEKDGDTIADFTSEFPSVPAEADAYISGGDLIWVASTSDVIADYVNGTFTGATSFAGAANSFLNGSGAGTIKAIRAAQKSSVSAGWSAYRTETAEIGYGADSPNLQFVWDGSDARSSSLQITSAEEYSIGSWGTYPLHKSLWSKTMVNRIQCYCGATSYQTPASTTRVNYLTGLPPSTILPAVTGSIGSLNTYHALLNDGAITQIGLDYSSVSGGGFFGASNEYIASVDYSTREESVEIYVDPVSGFPLFDENGYPRHDIGQPYDIPKYKDCVIQTITTHYATLNASFAQPSGAASGGVTITDNLDGYSRVSEYSPTSDADFSVEISIKLADVLASYGFGSLMAGPGDIPRLLLYSLNGKQESPYGVILGEVVTDAGTESLSVDPSNIITKRFVEVTL